MPIRKITWEEVIKATKDVTGQIRKFEQKRKKKFLGVYGVPRGGLIVAVMLSHALNRPYLGAPALNSIVADDVASSGKMVAAHSKTVTVALCKYKQCDPAPTFWSMEVEGAAVIFPWEEL